LWLELKIRPIVSSRTKQTSSLSRRNLKNCYLGLKQQSLTHSVTTKETLYVLVTILTPNIVPIDIVVLVLRKKNIVFYFALCEKNWSLGKEELYLREKNGVGDNLFSLIVFLYSSSFMLCFSFNMFKHLECLFCFLFFS
jgi:hypothetical protein